MRALIVTYEPRGVMIGLRLTIDQFGEVGDSLLRYGDDRVAIYMARNSDAMVERQTRILRSWRIIPT